MEKKPLSLTCAFGPSRAKARLLAVQPDEGWDSSGKVRPTARMFVLSLQGKSAAVVEELPGPPMLQAWYSPASDTAYCSFHGTNKLRVYHGGAWTEEVYRDAPPLALTSIFGFPAVKKENDQLFVGTSDALHVRVKGKWTRHAFDGGADQTHGREPSRVFVGGDKLGHWDGKQLTVIKHPKDDYLRCLWVTEDGRLIGGNHYFNVMDKDGAWSRLKGPPGPYTRMLEVMGVLYGSKYNGMTRILPGPPKVVKAVNYPGLLWSLGDGLVTMAREGTILFDGKTWAKVDMPAYKKGEKT
jgi:hypothetical protein